MRGSGATPEHGRPGERPITAPAPSERLQWRRTGFSAKPRPQNIKSAGPAILYPRIAPGFFGGRPMGRGHRRCPDGHFVLRSPYGLSLEDDQEVFYMETTLTFQMLQGSV